MSTLITYLMLLTFAFIDPAYAAVQHHLFPGDPSFSKLTPVLAHNHLFDHAPKVNVHQLNYRSIDSANGSPYSHYQINPTKTQGNKTLYWTKEIIKQGWRFAGIQHNQSATVVGHGVSFGGIFWPLETMQVTNKNGKLVYYNKIDIYAVKPITGHLFPLKVGNELKFHFSRYHLRDRNGKRQFIQEQGIMAYKVVKKSYNYPYAQNPVPGPVYSIEVWETTNKHPKPYLTDIYAYAPQLGWYISDTYFNKRNHKLAVYHLQS